MTRQVCWAVLTGAALAVLVAGCSRRAPRPSATTSPSRSIDVEGTDQAPSARRPARRYYMTRSEAGCEIYFVDPTRLSEAIHTPCPPSIRAGERIRIAGKTCVREADDTSRIEPVVCPDPLTNLERRERGERPGAPEPSEAGVADAGASD